MASMTELDLSFLHSFPLGKGRLILSGPGNSRHVLQHLSLSIIQRHCPLLALSFESSANGVPTADLAVPSMAAGICLVRFIYTKNYGWPEPESDMPLLLTAHVTMLAKVLDYTDLYLEANTNLLAKIDFAASFPSAPNDICATIRFLWEYSCASSIKESLLNYCVAAYQQHNLGSQPEFLKLSEEHVDFHMNLSRVNCEREYEQPGILLLPGPNRNPSGAVEDDWSIACAFSDHSEAAFFDLDPADDIDWEDGEDDTDGEQPPEKPQSLVLELPLRPKENPTDTETASPPSSPGPSAGFVIVDDPFRSPFDSDSESEWHMV